MNKRSPGTGGAQSRAGKNECARNSEKIEIFSYIYIPSGRVCDRCGAAGQGAIGAAVGAAQDQAGRHDKAVAAGEGTLFRGKLAKVHRSS